MKKFNDYPVYYAGDRVGGYPFEEIVPEDWQPGEPALWTFVYGDCDPPGGLFAEGGCAPPIQIQNKAPCEEWAGIFGDEPRLFDLRGAKALWNGGGLRIYTARTTIVIFALGEPKLAKLAARKLRPVGEAGPPERLTPPPPGSLRSKPPC